MTILRGLRGQRALRAMIVDDEPLPRDAIRLLLERDPEVAIAGECSGVSAQCP